MIESVWMKYHHGNSVCISSQVGCRMGCRFCASTIGGLVRCLTPSEMLDQIYRIQEDTGERVSNLVVMGTGEPMDNYDNLVRFVRLLSSQEGLNISQRNITVSTCGIVPNMYKLADEGLQITLALSLHAPNDEKRRELMPIANKYSIDEILDACRNYFAKTGRRITFVFASASPVGNLPNLFVVADGMGGHNAGDFASRYGVSVLVESVKRDTNFNPVRIIRHGIEAANSQIFEQAKRDISMEGMGTTMVVATVVGNYAYVANVGDSRLYLAADGTFDQVTQDHSLIAEMVRLGELTPEQARNHPDKNIITRAVGTQDTVKIDFFDIQLEEGNQLVMCSDGLSNMVTDEEIFELICREDGEDKAKRLIDKANANGGRDNIAVIVVEPFTNEVKEC